MEKSLSVSFSFSFPFFAKLRYKSLTITCKDYIKHDYYRCNFIFTKSSRSPPRINVPGKLSDRLKCSRASFSGRHSFIKDLNKNPNLNKLNLRPPHNYLPPEARDPRSFSLGLFSSRLALANHFWRAPAESGEKERRGALWSAGVPPSSSPVSRAL